MCTTLVFGGFGSTIQMLVLGLGSAGRTNHCTTTVQIAFAHQYFTHQAGLEVYVYNTHFDWLYFACHHETFQLHDGCTGNEKVIK